MENIKSWLTKNNINFEIKKENMNTVIDIEDGEIEVVQNKNKKFDIYFEKGNILEVPIDIVKLNIKLVLDIVDDSNYN